MGLGERDLRLLTILAAMGLVLCPVAALSVEAGSGPSDEPLKIHKSHPMSQTHAPLFIAIEAAGLEVGAAYASGSAQPRTAKRKDKPDPF